MNLVPSMKVQNSGRSRLFSAGKRHFSGERFIETCIIKKLVITHQEPIEDIKVWILLGYPSNILGDPSKYCNYTSKKKLGWFPHSPRPPPPVYNFFNIHLTKIIIEHKRYRI